MADKEYVNINEVEKVKVDVEFITCPVCGVRKESQEFRSNYLNTYLKEVKEIGYLQSLPPHINQDELMRNAFPELNMYKNSSENEKIFFSCWDCGHVYTEDEIKKTAVNIYKIDGLRCPKCKIDTPITNRHRGFNNGNVMCDKCQSTLEYVTWYRGGMVQHEFKVYTDYLETDCKNCGSPQMNLGDEIIIRNGGAGLILTFVCENCGQRGWIKTQLTTDRKRIKIVEE